MDLSEWKKLVADLPCGKRVGGHVYVHVSSLTALAAKVAKQLSDGAGVGFEAVHIVRFTQSKARVSLLSYPSFDSDGFPALAQAWSFDLDTGKRTSRSYRSDANPPILHRKELMVAPSHPLHGQFAALTAAVDAAGLLQDSEIIGHRLQWEEELKARGLAVVGHSLATLSEPQTSQPAAPVVMRHRTALTRRVLSTPMQALWRHGFLGGRYRVFDYGCGRGDDLAALEVVGVESAGWDPHFRPEAPRLEAEVVNLGFVLNVIEDLHERRSALVGAWTLTKHVLAVAALIGGRTAFEKHRLFRDGVLTTRGTFQKYYTHEELRDYILAAVGREPVSVAPGLYFVFREDQAEQEFLENRQRQRYRPDVPSRPPPREPREPSTSRRRDPDSVRQPRAAKQDRWDLHADLADRFWDACLSAGRLPLPGEFGDESLVRELLGTPKRVLAHLLEKRGPEELARARLRRREDLLVFLALNLFERRKSFHSLGSATQADIRDHWGSYAVATEDAKALLFSVADTKSIALACAEAAAKGLGYLVPSDSLTLDTRLANELPALLRVYVGCAGKLYGEVESGDVVKIHIGSGKLTVASYDDFEGREIPDLIERVKVDLRKRHVNYYQYGDVFAPQPLYMKSRYMNASIEGFEEQLAFDTSLSALPGLDFSGYGPPRSVVDAALGRPTMASSSESPAPDEPVRHPSATPEGA